MSSTDTTMGGRKQRAIAVILTLVIVACGGALALSSQFYTEAMVDAFFGLALASVLVLHMRIRPGWTDLACVIAGALFLAGVDFRVLHYQPRLMACFSFIGLSSFVVMAIRTVWSADRRMLLYAWVPAALFVMSDYFASTMLQWTSALHPKTLDLYLLSFDGSLGVQASFYAGQLYVLVPWLHTCSLIAYIGLAIPIVTVYAGRLTRFKERAFPAMLAFLVTGPLGIICYNLFPACGPHSLFQQGFPFHPFPFADLPRLALEPVALQSARNAMPSLHFAWTLLAWWYSRGLSWIERAVAFAFLGFTAFATLGIGEHWVADLIVAFPFAVMIQAACAYDVPWKDSRRKAAFFLGLASTLAWMVTLRFGTKLFWASPIVPWALSAATISLACIRQVSLSRASDSTDPIEASGKRFVSRLREMLMVSAAR